MFILIGHRWQEWAYSTLNIKLELATQNVFKLYVLVLQEKRLSGWFGKGILVNFPTSFKEESSELSPT